MICLQLACRAAVIAGHRYHFDFLYKHLTPPHLNPPIIPRHYEPVFYFGGVRDVEQKGFSFNTSNVFSWVAVRRSASVAAPRVLAVALATLLHRRAARLRTDTFCARPVRRTAPTSASTTRGVHPRPPLRSSLISRRECASHRLRSRTAGRTSSTVDCFRQRICGSSAPRSSLATTTIATRPFK
jgi:hypothetical protein